METRLVPVPPDNYVILLTDPNGPTTVVVDPGQAPVVEAALAEGGRTLTHILVTHHHADHIGGAAELTARFGCRVIGCGADRRRIPAITDPVSDGETFTLADERFLVMETPGHTVGHICFHLPLSNRLFSGDTLFMMGCGRLFEGTPDQMWSSLTRLRSLPDETEVFCAHEYTEANARFAVALTPGDPTIGRRVEETRSLRAVGRPTVPGTIARERAENPFLRADDPSIAAAVGLIGAEPVAVFAEIRRRKDVFRG